MISTTTRRLLLRRSMASASPSVASLQRNFSSTSTSNVHNVSSPAAPPLLHPSSLGLFHSIPPDSLESACQLPEVAACLPSDTDNRLLPPNERISSLKRAADIFEQFQPGGIEHRTVLALLADVQNDTAQYDDACRTLQRLLTLFLETSTGNGDDDGFSLYLALAKALYNAGVFDEAVEIATVAHGLTTIEATEDVDPALVMLKRGIATNAILLSNLAGSMGCKETMDSSLLEWIDENRGMSAISTLCLETFANTSESDIATQSTHSMACATAANNQGVTELFFASVRARIENAEGVDTDIAIEKWRNGLDQIKSEECALADAIKARLHTNIATTLLHPNGGIGTKKQNKETIDEDTLSSASEHARNALKLCDGIVDNAGQEVEASLRPLTGRSLYLVADCYARSGSAVTAEGLYQAAIDKFDEDGPMLSCPLSAIELQQVYEKFACLYDNWEKRAGDAKKMREKRDGVKLNLKEGWSSAPAIFAGTWMPTLIDYLREQED